MRDVIGGAHDPMPDALAYVARRTAAERERRSALAVVRDGERVIVCTDPVDCVVADGRDALVALDRLWRAGGFWVGALAYDLGRAIEQVDVGNRGGRDGAGPADACRGADRPHDIAFTRFAKQLVFSPNQRASFDGNYGGHTTPVAGAGVGLGVVASSMSREEHGDAVDAIHGHLRAGDCYQVNLTRQLATACRADPRALFAALACRNPAPHAALIELDGVTLVGASPERFLRIEGDLVETRPIKGTHASAVALAASAKDRAEHVMIVDMARNDLGRVCTLGSVGVAALAEVEHHPGLTHLVSTVHGRLRPGAGLGDVVRATFPPASITGAPKPRVMQIIDALEPLRRGYYCGAHGWIDADAKRADLAVTIRTFVVSREGTSLGVGGGVVADSTATGEWDESCLKAARLLGAAGAYEAQPVPEMAAALR